MYLGSVAYCDDCSPSGDWEMFAAPIVIMFFVIIFFYLQKINIKVPSVLLSASALPVYIMSFYGAMIFPIPVMQTAASYQRALLTYGLLALKHTITLVINLLFESISLCYVCVCGGFAQYTWAMCRYSPPQWSIALFTNAPMDKWTFSAISTCSIGLTQAI